MTNSGQQPSQLNRPVAMYVYMRKKACICMQDHAHLSDFKLRISP